MNWEEEGIISVSNITTLFHDQTGLMPLTIYDARVLSVNFNGASDFSYFVRFRTVGKSWLKKFHYLTPTLSRDDNDRRRR